MESTVQLFWSVISSTYAPVSKFDSPVFVVITELNLVTIFPVPPLAPQSMLPLVPAEQKGVITLMESKRNSAGWVMAACIVSSQPAKETRKL